MIRLLGRLGCVEARVFDAVVRTQERNTHIILSNISTPQSSVRYFFWLLAIVYMLTDASISL